MYAQVAIFTVGLVGEAFTYSVPPSMEQLCVEGSIVEVPFGKQTLRALVLVCTRDLPIEAAGGIKEMVGVVGSSMLSQSACTLIMRMSRYYRAPLHKVLRLFVPEKIWHGRFSAQYTYEVTLQIHLEDVPSRMHKVHKILEDLERGKDVIALYSSREIQNLVERGWIAVKRKELRSVYRHHESKDTIPPLTQEQKNIVCEIQKNVHYKYLLHGVTGAGKTRIYLELARHMAALGKQTLILVPEIALTPQLVQYFSTAFPDQLSVLHSHLSEGERCQEWMRITSRVSQVIIGSRSALFAPIQEYGAIIIDEEHEWTYKNEQNPRYHARMVTNFLHEATSCLVLLGSATPSVETMYEAEQGAYKLLSLQKKIYEQIKEL